MLDPLSLIRLIEKLSKSQWNKRIIRHYLINIEPQWLYGDSQITLLCCKTRIRPNVQHLEQDLMKDFNLLPATSLDSNALFKFARKLSD